jgi:hypothetical protein
MPARADNRCVPITPEVRKSLFRLCPPLLCRSLVPFLVKTEAMHRGDRDAGVDLAAALTLPSS